mmetsp:Transcript_12486/g.35070  ORF Transcript_12486/g.35070 Transcript_12486/m.35070 type:complete len:224 (+) Transcript_12486:2421-3092(+)
MAPASRISTLLSSLKAKLPRQPAAASLPDSVPFATRSTSGGMAPALAIATLLASSKARLPRAPAAASLPASDSSSSRFTSGGIAPASAITFLKSSFRASSASAVAAASFAPGRPSWRSATSAATAPASRMESRMSSRKARCASRRALASGMSSGTSVVTGLGLPSSSRLRSGMAPTSWAFQGLSLFGLTGSTETPTSGSSSAPSLLIILIGYGRSEVSAVCTF